MRKRRRTLGSILAAACALAALAILPASASALRPFQMGMLEPEAESTLSSADVIMGRTRAAGARIVRGNVYWNAVAPNTTNRPGSLLSPFHARDPSSRYYRWYNVDGFVRKARARGLTPVLTVLRAPAWAEGTGTANATANDREARRQGAFKIIPRDLGDFAYAMAKRYPRVHFFQAWNEPNFGTYLWPQSDRRSGAAAGAIHYVAMLNAFYANVKQVSGANRVLVGGLGPFGKSGGPGGVDPQAFMKSMFCLRGRVSHLTAKPGCHLQPRFDIFAAHPYTLAGTPTTRARSRDGGAIGNLRDMRRIIDKKFPRRHKDFWATEFDWWSNPPDTRIGKPLAVGARYVSQSAYVMWRSGVSTLVWYELRDAPSVQYWPGGLYFRGRSLEGDRRKPALRAFKFPFYGTGAGRGHVRLWGLVSSGGRTKVSIEVRRGRRWRRVAVLRSTGAGIFYARVRAPRGLYQARALNGRKRGLVSYPYPIH